MDPSRSDPSRPNKIVRETLFIASVSERSDGSRCGSSMIVAEPSSDLMHKLKGHLDLDLNSRGMSSHDYNERRKAVEGLFSRHEDYAFYESQMECEVFNSRNNADVQKAYAYALATFRAAKAKATAEAHPLHR